jgi:hypothetical protein
MVANYDPFKKCKLCGKLFSFQKMSYWKFFIDSCCELNKNHGNYNDHCRYVDFEQLPSTSGYCCGHCQILNKQLKLVYKLTNKLSGTHSYYFPFSTQLLYHCIFHEHVWGHLGPTRWSHNKTEFWSCLITSKSANSSWTYSTPRVWRTVSNMWRSWIGGAFTIGDCKKNVSLENHIEF